MFSWTRPGLLAHPWGGGVAYASPKPQGLIGWWGAERAKEGKWFYKREPWCFCQNRDDGTLGRKTWPSRFFHKPPPRRRLACLCHMVPCPSWRCRQLIGDFLGHPFLLLNNFSPSASVLDMIMRQRKGGALHLPSRYFHVPFLHLLPFIP